MGLLSPSAEDLEFPSRGLRGEASCFRAWGLKLRLGIMAVATFTGVLDARLLPAPRLTNVLVLKGLWPRAQLTSPKIPRDLVTGHPAHGTSLPGRCTPGAHAGPRSQSPPNAMHVSRAAASRTQDPRYDICIVSGLRA